MTSVFRTRSQTLISGIPGTGGRDSGKGQHTDSFVGYRDSTSDTVVGQTSTIFSQVTTETRHTEVDTKTSYVTVLT